MHHNISLQFLSLFYEFNKLLELNHLGDLCLPLIANNMQLRVKTVGSLSFHLVRRVWVATHRTFGIGVRIHAQTS